MKLYVKEAFSRENMPASDERISTWADFRENLARNMFPFLRSAANSGSLVMKDAAAILMPAAEADLIGLFSVFDQWQAAEFWNELQIDAKRLSDNTAPEIADIGQSILSAIEDFDHKAAPSKFATLAALAASIKEIVDTKKKETDKKLQEALNIQVNKNRAFLDELAFLPVLWFVNYSGFDPELILIPALLLLAGHNFSVWLKFRGGRGLATGAGIFLAVNFSVIIIWLVLYFVLSKLSKNIHIASAAALIILPMTLILMQGLVFRFTNPALRNSEGELTFLFSFCSSVCLIILFRHTEPLLAYFKNKNSNNNNIHKL